ncbi:MAG: sigma-54-dependent Fis family transcriptional regulator [Deltaproteobacteria bacterium]|nr:sigma-54-dependent Fis family transcriptional regulator [Deltaproteobacteria bacterium]
MANVLVVDDDKLICEVLCSFIESMGHGASFALTQKEALQKVFSDTFDLVFLDVRLPDGNGLTMVPKIRKTPSCPEIIIITGEGSQSGAKMAMESGCWDYIEKPLSIETLRLPFLRAIQYRKEKAGSNRPVALKRDGIIGSSQPLKECLNLVARAGETDANVLIYGETGTGKELFAKAIHDNSPRADKAFVVVDCATLPETLVESTLLGHAKGAFTGADRSRSGLIKEADGGTLFLDEVGDLPLAVQPAFLRVLQEHRFRPIGEAKEVRSDFRLVAATNRDMDQMVKAGKFRSDLLFRLKSLVIQLPALKERSDDIMDLTMYFLKKLSDRYGCGIKGLSPDFCEAVLSYSWPGNVRELAQTIERVISIALDEPTLYPVHLPTDIRSELKMASVHPKKPEASALEKTPPFPAASFPKLRELVESTEKQYFEELISMTGGDMKAVCRLSGLSRANVYARLNKYQIARRS